MKTVWAVGIGLCLFAAIQGGPARGEDETSRARGKLEREMEILRWLERDVERPDFARLRFIETNVRLTLDSINEKGLAHSQTIRYFQQLKYSFSYSKSFFSHIETDETHDRIQELLALHDDILRQLGLDTLPVTQITADVFNQMHKLFQQLRDSGTLGSDLEKKVTDLIAPIGHVIAIARLGDRPKTFEAGTVVYRKIVALYPDFNRVESADAAFDIVMEIQGLNEVYGDLSQANEGDRP